MFVLDAADKTGIEGKPADVECWRDSNPVYWTHTQSILVSPLPEKTAFARVQPTGKSMDINDNEQDINYNEQDINDINDNEQDITDNEQYIIDNEQDINSINDNEQDVNDNEQDINDVLTEGVKGSNTFGLTLLETPLMRNQTPASPFSFCVCVCVCVHTHARTHARRARKVENQVNN